MSVNIYEHEPFVKHFAFVQDRHKRNRLIQHIYNILHSCMLPIQNVELVAPNENLQSIVQNSNIEHEYWVTALTLKKTLVDRFNKLLFEESPTPKTARKKSTTTLSTAPITTAPKTKSFIRNFADIEQVLAANPRKPTTQEIKKNRATIVKFPSQVNLMHQPFALDVVSILRDVNLFSTIPNTTKESILSLARNLEQILQTNTFTVLQQKNLAFKMLCDYQINDKQELSITDDDFALIRLITLKELLNKNVHLMPALLQ